MQRSLVDHLAEIYTELRPDGLTQFTATIQLDEGDRRRVIQDALKPVLMSIVDRRFRGYRIVAANFVVKQPGPWVVEPHQDFDFLDETRWRAVLGWIPLHDVDVAGGCLHVVPGSHDLATVPRGSGDHRFPFAPVLEHLKSDRSVSVPLRKGEAVLYDARTLHWSTGNGTAVERVAAAFAAIPSDVELLHHHVNEDGTVTVVAVDDDIYADTPFHGYPVRGCVVATRPLPEVAPYDVRAVDEALAHVNVRGRQGTRRWKHRR